MENGQRFTEEEARVSVGATLVDAAQRRHGEVIGYGLYEGEVTEDGFFLWVEWQGRPAGGVDRQQLTAQRLALVHAPAEATARIA